MMIPQQKLLIALLFAGIFCTMWGIVLLDPFRENEISSAFRWGAFKDGAVTKEGRQAFAPWIITVGALSFIGAFLLRERD